MKSLSPRERIMITVLPGAVLLLAYLFLLARPAQEEVKELKRRLGVAAQSAPTSQARAGVLSQLTSLESTVKAKRDAAEERRAREQYLLSYWNNPDAKAEGGQFVGDLLASHGVILVEEAIAGEEDQSEFGPLLEALPSAELWRLRLAGDYEAIRRTLEALGNTTLPLVPAGIEMEPLVEGNRTIHLWTLWICR